MKDQRVKFNLSTITVHAVGWCLLLVTPMLFVVQTVQEIEPSMKRFAYLPLFMMTLFHVTFFYTNYFVLVPRFFFRQRYGLYVLSILAILLVSMALSYMLATVSGFEPEAVAANNPTLSLIRPIANTNALLMLFAAIVTSLALAYSDQLKKRDKEIMEARLASLQSQINPHFLFNTLNSIYAKALPTSPLSAEMVAKLSDMMRYAMRDVTRTSFPLEDEVEYVRNYIDLQKVRMDASVQLEVFIEGDFEGYQITPMLLIPFVENAFKHGVNPEQRSKILIDLKMEGDELRLTVINHKVKVQKEINERSGVGLQNTRSRLGMIYPKQHLLMITETEKEYKVTLSIHLA